MSVRKKQTLFKSILIKVLASLSKYTKLFSILPWNIDLNIFLIV